MAQETRYSRFQHRPKWYRPRIPIFWWVHKWEHVRFIARELTSVFVALFVLELLFQFRALVSGPEAYEAFLSWLKTPTSLILHTIAFLFAVFHSVTWFNLAPKALVLKVGSKRIPNAVIVGVNYLSWGVLSAALAWIML